jgi:hypothetical protein
MGPLPENLKDEAGAVEHLRIPRCLEVALLHRCERVIDDDELGFLGAHEACEFLDLTRAEQRRGSWARHRHKPARLDVEVDRRGEANGLLEPCLLGTERSASARRRRHFFTLRLGEHRCQHDRVDAAL